MADELDALLERIDDEGLRSELQDHIRRLRRKREFGLVFESHLPERARLPDHPIRRGSRVVRRDPDAKTTPQTVLRVRKESAVLDSGDDTTEEVALADLVVVSEFGEPIYPGLARLGSIDRGGNKPAHVVIKGENYHALEALRFSHTGKVDCIYIDPPYNTGARDWKYNNDYVDESDTWRHSKWLAMMARRLTLAGQLLADDGVLVVTIDEHEVHHLRMLLEQTFPSAFLQMVTIVVNPKGVAQGRFARVEEYALFCFFGDFGVQATPDDFMSDSATQRNTRFWKGLLRAGTNALPADGLGMVFPVFVDPSRGRVQSLGKTLRQRIDEGVEVSDPNEWVPPRNEAPEGCATVWPVRRDGALGVWQTVPETFLALNEGGMIRCVERPEGWALSYVPSGVRKKLESGEVSVTGREGGDGPVLLERSRDLTRAKTVWKRARHDAGWHGSVLLRKLLGERLFDFPKSLYAVRDTLLPLLTHKPDAVVLDFFAGSGTTAHAVALLNMDDGGHRSSISITNNEVGEAEARSLSRAGYRAGDEEWERRGIFDLVTRPRVAAAVTGRRPDGKPIDIDYVNEIPMSVGLEENVEFLELKYLDVVDIELDRAFESVAALLWLRAGGAGTMIDRRCDDDGDPKAYDLTDRYGILFNPDHWRAFVAELPNSAATAFVVTDSPSVFALVASELPGGVEAVRLYENYLSTFAINHRRSP